MDRVPGGGGSRQPDACQRLLAPRLLNWGRMSGGFSFVPSGSAGIVERTQQALFQEAHFGQGLLSRLAIQLQNLAGELEQGDLRIVSAAAPMGDKLGV